IALATDTSDVAAYIGDGASVTQADDVQVSAQSHQVLSAQAAGGALGLAAGGASVGEVSAEGSTRAYLGSNVQIGQVQGHSVADLLLSAEGDVTATTSEYMVAVGIGAGAGNDATSTIAPHLEASIGAGSDVT